MTIKRLMGAAALAITLLGGTTASQAAVVDLGFAIDESGSMSNADVNLARQGLANALNLIPTSGDNQYRVAIVRFNSSAQTLVEPVVLTAATRTSIQNTLLTTPRISGGTATDTAVNLLTSLYSNAGFGDTTLFNVTTDGGTNRTTLVNSAAAALAAGVEGLSFEAVGGFSATNLETLRLAAYGANPALEGVVVNAAADLPNPTQQGFVFTVDNFAGYEDAITSKVGRIVEDTGGGSGNGDPVPAVPLPAGLPMLIAALGALGLVRRRMAA